MYKRPDIAIINTLKTILFSQLGERLVSIILFGSQARGEGLAGSDMDIFLLARELPDHPFERQIFLRRLVPKGFPSQVSIYAKTVDEFERDFLAIYLDIATDGLILFDKDGYVHKKLEQIKEIIDQAGLYRIKRMDQMLWRWKDSPDPGWRIDWSGVHGLKRGCGI